MNSFRTQKYLDRLGLSNCSCDFEGLKAIQQKHMLNIPFENLDVVVGRDVVLDRDSLFNKVVERMRGGYCFELNMLHSMLLGSLGFKAKPVLGRVWLRDPKKLPPRNHLTHLVMTEDTTFVTDVGFGGFAPRVPLNINSNKEVNDGDGIVRVIKLECEQYMVQRMVGHEWLNQYSFEDRQISNDDINIANFYMSKSKDSHFSSNRFIGIYTEHGRVGLFENTLTERVGIETINTLKLNNPHEWLLQLNSTFKIPLDFTSSEFDKLLVRWSDKSLITKTQLSERIRAQNTPC